MTTSSVSHSGFSRPVFWGAFLLGIGLMAAVDEIVFHQLLRWHHFIDRDGGDFGLISDGLLHTAEVFAFVVGFFVLMRERQNGRLSRLTGTAGLLVGLGGFQLWDGVINHKVLKLHQIRYDVDVLPYDIAWNVIAGIVLACGVALAVLARRRAHATEAETSAR